MKRVLDTVEELFPFDLQLFADGGDEELNDTENDEELIDGDDYFDSQEDPDEGDSDDELEDSEGDAGEEEDEEDEETEEDEEDEEDEETDEDGDSRLLAGKYKTVDELEKAYKNLQPQFTKKAQELAELKRKFMQENLPAKPQPTGNAQVDNAAMFNYAVKLQTAQLEAKIDALAIKETISSLHQSDKYFKEVAPKMYELLEKNPEKYFNDPDGVMRAYKDAKADMLDDIIEAKIQLAKKTGRDEAYTTKSKKSKLGSRTNAAPKRNKGNKKSIEDIIGDGIVNAPGGGSIFKI